MTDKKHKPEVPGHSELHLSVENRVRPDMPDPLADAVACRVMFEAMLERLMEKRKEGRHGWHQPDVCSIEDLYGMFEKTWIKVPTNWLDVAIFAMMLWHRNRHE